MHFLQYSRKPQRIAETAKVLAFSVVAEKPFIELSRCMHMMNMLCTLFVTYNTLREMILFYWAYANKYAK